MLSSHSGEKCSTDMDRYLESRQKDEQAFVYASGRIDSASISYRSPVTPRRSKRHELDMSHPPMTGTIFTDNMLNIEHTSGLGWSRPVLEPLKPLQLHPGAKVLHYAIEIFEGIKAYRGKDGKVRLFRPHDHIRRFNNSARRACLPTVNVEEFVKCLEALVVQERDWIPEIPNGYLYIRPSMIGTEFTLGPTESRTALLFVVCSPGAPCHGGVNSSMRLYVNPNFERTAKGVGMAKMGCNYAGSFALQRLAAKQGCRQILWLTGKHQEVTECSSMNIFVLWTNEDGELELVTPSLQSEQILPGITRMSVIDLVNADISLQGRLNVVEKRLLFDDIIDGIEEGRVHEIFGTGSAVGVAPVSAFVVAQDDGALVEYELPENPAHSICCDLFERIRRIQMGEDSFKDWTYQISKV